MMARKTKSERIQILENEVARLNTIKARQTGIKTIKGQGSDGATTEFIDPLVIERQLALAEGKLEMEYRIL